MPACAAPARSDRPSLAVARSHHADLTQLGLHAQAARNAIRDAGIDKDQIDGLACAGESVVAVADYLDIQPRYLDGTSIGGSSFMIHVAHAVLALAAGYCNYVLITHGESGRSRDGRGGFGGGAATIPGQFEAPYGTMGPPNTFTVPIVAHMAKYGTTEEQLAAVAVATRAWAAQNPRAMMRDPRRRHRDHDQSGTRFHQVWGERSGAKGRACLPSG